MAIYEDEIVLCGASAYTKLFFIDENFEGLPEDVKKELKIMCVMFTEDVGGTLMLVFDEEGNLELRTDGEENDFFYDEIGSVLKVKQLRQNHAQLLEELETYYKIFFLGLEE